MRVDFYQLAGLPVEQVIASLGEKIVGQGERLVIVAGDDGQLARLDRMLWDYSPASFLPHGLAGGAEDSRQPILLSKTSEPANRARNILIADGHWRDSALSFHRAFFLFDQNGIEAGRRAWRSLASGDDVERHYWANTDGRWTEQAPRSKTR